MINQELYFENLPVDLNRNEPFFITNAIDDIADFAAKNTAKTKTVVIPGTPNNNKLFNFYFDCKTRPQHNPNIANIGANFNAAKAVQFIYFVDNIEIMKGTARMLRVVESENFIEYEVFFTGELGGFTAKVGAARLEDLGINSSHVYNIDQVTESYPHGNTSVQGVFCYPLLDLGHGDVNKHNFNYRNVIPALFVKDYFVRIFEKSGYTINFPLGETLRFRKLIVPYTKKEFQKIGATTLLQASGTGTPFNLSTFTTLGGFVNNGTPTNNFTYTSTTATSGNVTIGVSPRTIMANGSGLLEIKLQMYKNGNLENESLLQTIFVSSNQTYFAAGGNATFINVGFTQNDVISFQIFYSLPISTTSALSGHNVNIVNDSGQLVRLNLGDTFNTSDLVPRNYLQLDFLSSILKLFNLYVTEDKFKNKHLNITPFIDYYNESTLPAEDWTKIVDHSKPIITTPMGDLNARYYNFSFKKDNDFFNDIYNKRYNRSYGDYVFDSKYEFAKDKQDISIIFSATPLVGYQGEDKIYSTIVKNSTPFEPTDSNIRILQLGKINCNSYTLLNDQGQIVGQPLTTYMYAGHYNDPNAPTNDIHFGVPEELFFTLATGAVNVTQFNVYWSSYMAEITNIASKVLTLYVFLSVVDYSKIDFSRKIFLFGQYWRLNKIIDFDTVESNVTKVELIKIINEVY